jgi:hypothetical protein
MAVSMPLAEQLAALITAENGDSSATGTGLAN